MTSHPGDVVSTSFRPATRRALPTPVLLGDLKAVFFVRDFVGNAEYNERKKFSPPASVRKGAECKVVFKDNEVLVGSLDGDLFLRPGLFVTPADPASNNIRVYALRPRSARFDTSRQIGRPATAVRAPCREARPFPSACSPGCGNRVRIAPAPAARRVFP